MYTALHSKSELCIGIASTQSFAFGDLTFAFMLLVHRDIASTQLSICIASTQSFVHSIHLYASAWMELSLAHLLGLAMDFVINSIFHGLAVFLPN